MLKLMFDFECSDLEEKNKKELERLTQNYNKAKYELVTFVHKIFDDRVVLRDVEDEG